VTDKQYDVMIDGLQWLTKNSQRLSATRWLKLP